MNNLKENWLVLCVLVLALYMRLQLMTRSLFYDELYVAVHGVQAHSLYEALFKEFSSSNHLGYTALAYITCHVLGTSELPLRLPALLFGLGSIYILWQWSQKYFGKAIAILGALLLALAPAHIIWSASARGYSACVFFTILSTALYFSLLEKPCLKTLIMLVLTNSVAPSFHVYFLCIIVVQLFHYLSIPDKAKTKIFVLTSIGAEMLLSLLLYYPLLADLGRMAVDHRDLVANFPLTLFNDLLSVPFWPLGSFCLILMVIGFIQPSNKLPRWRIYMALLFLMVLPLWLMKPVYLYPRFFAYLLPFMLLLLANGAVSVVNISPDRMKPFIKVLIAAVIGMIIWTWLTKPSKIMEDFHYKFRESVQFAESAAGSQTKFCAFGNEDDFFQFYSDRPVRTFKTFDEFRRFYDQENQIICFCMNGPPMPEEHKKIFLFTLSLPQAKAKNFDNIIVFDLKD